MKELISTITFEEFGAKRRASDSDVDSSLGDFGAGEVATGGDTVGYRLAMVKERDDFLDVFEGATHVDAITYAETADLMVKMLSEDGLGIDTMDVLIGNAEEYQENKVQDVTTAESLLEFKQDDRLTIRLKNQKTVHSKIYRVVMPDDSVKLVHGSANLSKNSWENHTNQISIFETTVGSELDVKFKKFIKEYRQTYGYQTLLDGLVESVKQADTDEEKREMIKIWLGPGDLDVNDFAGLNISANEDIEEAVSKAAAVIEDPEEADKTIAPADDCENVDHPTINSVTNTSNEETEADGGSTVKSPDVELVESDQETTIEETLDRPRINAADKKIRMGTAQMSDDDIDEFSTGMANKGATVDDSSITSPIEAYNNQVKEETEILNMSVVPESDQVVVGDDDEMVLVAHNEPTPAELNHCLKTIEDYIETVERHNYVSSNQTATMAQMYEVFLYGFWAPFVNEYAKEFTDSRSDTLSNLLKHLYIQGKSDAGKDELIEYILRLISDADDISGVDADDVGIRQIRGITNYDTCFPYAIIDSEKDQVEGMRPIRNYWKDYSKALPDSPCLIFTTNDTLPASEFRNRMKVITLNAQFPSDNEDKGYEEADEDLSETLERRNPIFSYVAREMLNEKPWTDNKQTIGDVREIFNRFYEKADREKPRYFPADMPAEKKFSTGRINWTHGIQSGRIEFEPDINGITAHFDMESWQVHDYQKRLPKAAVGDEPSGTRVAIEEPEVFADWIGYTVEELLTGEADESDELEYTTESDDSDKDDSDDGFFSRFF